MSLYIKGINLPKKDESIKIEIFSDGGVWIDWGARYERRDSVVKEISTSHGDLIDRDMVRDECYKTMEELMQSTTINMSAEALSLLCGFTTINNASTILEAEDKRTDATADKSSQLTGRTTDDWY